MLVAHANVNQLFLPVVPPGVDVDAAYGCVSAWSLAKLQNEIADKFASFDQARKAVVPHLLDDSWVTIRACNIGNSAETLYALFAFFGGRANVYAPTKFMAFSDCVIKAGNRIRLEVRRLRLSRQAALPLQQRAHAEATGGHRQRSHRS